MKRAAAVAIALFALSCGTPPRKAIERGFAELTRLQDMKPGQTYQVQLRGTPVTGLKERFLRVRTGPEVLASGLASGCGDYAVAFIHLMEKRGLEAMLVDGAEISTQSLRSAFSGHAVVAVRNGAGWILADPTNRRILADPWSPGEKMFGNYWIGFCGRLTDYPTHDAESLRAFYRATLKTIPVEVWNRHVFRFRFTVDPSLVGAGGKYLNPNLDEFLRTHGKILAEHGIQPEKEVAITLIKGDDDAHSTLKYSEGTGWVCRLGLKSMCSSSFLAFLERGVQKQRL